MSAINIEKRMTLDEVCIVFFGNVKLVKCIKREYSPKSWFWQKNFRIKEHGRFLSHLLFNGVFDKESGIIVHNFFTTYYGRIVGSNMPTFRKCISNRVPEYGFDIACLHTMFAHLTKKQVFLNHEPSCKLFYKVLPSFKPGRSNMLRCAYLDLCVKVYNELNKHVGYININDNTPEELVNMLYTGDVYSKVLPFTDKLVLSGLIKVCISKLRPSTIDKVKQTLNKVLSNNDITSDKVSEILSKFDKCVHLLKEDLK